MAASRGRKLRETITTVVYTQHTTNAVATDLDELYDSRKPARNRQGVSAVGDTAGEADEGEIDWEDVKWSTGTSTTTGTGATQKRADAEPTLLVMVATWWENSRAWVTTARFQTVDADTDLVTTAGAGTWLFKSHGSARQT